MVFTTQLPISRIVSVSLPTPKQPFLDSTAFDSTIVVVLACAASRGGDLAFGRDNLGWFPSKKAVYFLKKGQTVHPAECTTWVMQFFLGAKNLKQISK